MPRHRLTDSEMLRGVEKALASKKTPDHLRPGLRRLQQRLRRKVSRPKRKGKEDFLSRFLGL